MTRMLTFAAVALLAACAAENQGTIIVESLSAETRPTSVLSAEERFETLYVGSWSESGGCGPGETEWEIREDMVVAGERSCAIMAVGSATSLLEAELVECLAEGVPLPDRKIQLDVAGTDILYLTTSDGKRHRLERCTSG